MSIKEQIAALPMMPENTLVLCAPVDESTERVGRLRDLKVLADSHSKLLAWCQCEHREQIQSRGYASFSLTGIIEEAEKL